MSPYRGKQTCVERYNGFRKSDRSGLSIQSSQRVIVN